MEPGESLPPAKKAKLVTSSDINGLSDEDLSAIFKRLPPLDRLRISEVCTRWHGISRNAWLDINHLDLSPIPGPNIAAIIKQCPNLRSVFAMGSTFRASELRILSHTKLQSLKLYDCTVSGLRARQGRIRYPLSAIFSANLRFANWEELVLDGFFVRVRARDLAEQGDVDLELPASFPASLRRLQLTHLTDDLPVTHTFLQGLERMTELECLMLNNSWPADARKSIGALQNLRELLICRLPFRAAADIVRRLLNLAKLETLFLHDVDLDLNNADFITLVTKHPALRVLVLTDYSGIDDDMEFPARVRYGNGFKADPLPQLHIFVGRTASEGIRFPRFPSDVAKVYPISEPLPEFLQREDIKPIFEGVWIAQQIKDAAKRGSVLLDYASDVVATSFRSIDT